MWSSRTWVSMNRLMAPPGAGSRLRLRVEQNTRYPTPPTSTIAASALLESMTPVSLAIMERLQRTAATQGRPTESPLPLWERDRVRGCARTRAESPLEDGERQQTIRGRLPAPDPSPCPSPARGEGTL